MKRTSPIWLRLFLTIAVLAAFEALVAQCLAEEQLRSPILITGVQEPGEMQVEPFPTTKLDPTAPEKMLGEALQNSDNSKPTTLLPALNRILAQYSDFSDGYFMRAFALCDSGNDLPAITADLDRALKFIASARNGKNSILSLLSTRAKIEFANGNYLTAMNELEKAILTDLGKAPEFTNSGAAKPEKSTSVCVWSESDMDELVRRFPTDYRSHMLRGLYFSFFVNFSLEDWISTRAIESFNKAAQLNQKSALPQLFKARILGNFNVFNKRLNQVGWTDTERNKLYIELVGEYSKALALDPNLLPALIGRALAFFHLKQFQKAIDDYDRILSLDKQDKASFHDRGLSKMFLDRDYDAISDFSSAIQIQPRELLKHDSYESRADAYMKTRQWDLAIRDLTTAISLQVGGGVLLMNIDQFRAIYPEYNSISNEAIARKLQQTFYPNLNYEDFAKGFFAKRALPSTVIPDLYLKRSDAYLKSGNWRWAAIEFHRAIKGFPDYADAVERWRALDSANGAQNYIDMRTFNDVGSNSISFWIKEVRGSDETGSPYSLMQYELNCDAHRIRQLSLQNYDSSGAPISSRESGPWWPWQAIIPDTLGEMFYSRVCRAS